MTTIGGLVDALAPVLAHAGLVDARAEARDLVAALAGRRSRTRPGARRFVT
ncbi:MAG TPA: hypothetical protein VGD56_13760 [Gemmatirosa sp.]